jgi:hypothetical protein
VTHSELFSQIETMIPKMGGWATPLKCCEFASIILGTRPNITVELGTWCGRGAFSMALAHRFVGSGRVIAVDPWSAPAAAEGQDGENEKWWNDQSKHDYAHAEFMRGKMELGIEQYVHVYRETSAKAPLPDQCGLLIIDGNHGPQAIKDVERWAPIVTRSGYVYLDDMNWSGGAVAEAGKLLLKMGFSPMWARDEGMFYRRER